MGDITLSYQDGTKQNIPLIVGDNIGTLYMNYVTGVEKIPDKELDYVNIMKLGCYPDKKLETITINVTVYDSELALIAVNYVC